MKKSLLLIFSIFVVLFPNIMLGKNAKTQVVGYAYTTTADKKLLFSKSAVYSATSKGSTASVITLQPNVRYQEMDGFGTAITGSTCYNLLKMSAHDRAKILREVFDPKTGMGHSYIRISIGCSDFSMDEYTYCDSPGIENFEIHHLDKRDLFPILREILCINPNVKILASPWTAPRWMKVNNLTDLQPHYSWTSGQLHPQYYASYATYFVKYIQAMRAEGFPIEAITIQNEPLNRGNSASMFMTWQEQRDFIKTALGPQFRAANISTKIMAYDHNYDYDITKAECADQVDYPTHIYNDSDAAQYIHGSAWHAYGGNASELDDIRAAHPAKSILFTEISIGDWGYTFAGDLLWCMKEVALGTINRYGKGVIVWNLMLDQKNGPDRPGGCNTCYGAIRVKSPRYAYSSLERLSHYYVISHLSKVVKPGAQRISSQSNDVELESSAFQNPDGSYAMVFANDNLHSKTVSIMCNGKPILHYLPAKSISSISWRE